jgi:hypothetical protein
MMDLLIVDARQRSGLDPRLWPIARDARVRIDAAVQMAFGTVGLALNELWLLAEASGRIVGMAHAMFLPVPPIYRAAGGLPGLILDDCFTVADAPAGTMEALLRATEAELRAMGASRLVASCPVGGPWRTVFERAGYEPVTLYMGKHGFTDRALPAGVRPARLEDVPAIVSLSAFHRRTLAELNPRFWRIDPDADSRFEDWMRQSLTRDDRSMFVAEASGTVHGYIIAQPISPLLMPDAHDINAIGVVDDYYDRDFADVASITNGGTLAAGLLSAAESAFARRSYAAALVVCPAAWTGKVSLLEREGWHAAKLWMLKRD